MEYSKLYDSAYYQSSCGNISYDSDHFYIFFENVANEIINAMHPTTVLDVGCAFGYLVTALRDRGVAAYGIDVSEYAISQVRKDIKPYCKVCSALDPLPVDFPQTYDVVTTIEVAEHLYEEDGIQFIKNICTYTDHIIFSSTPDDITEKTHFNVQQPEYWAKKFAANNFYRKFDGDLSFISPQAALFIHGNITKERVIENYERHIRISKVPPKNAFGRLYFDTGHGLNDGEFFNITDMINNQIDAHFTFPAETIAARFDPVETPCVIKNFEVVSNTGAEITVTSNGTALDEYIIFTTSGPQIFLDFNSQKVDWIEIKCSIFPFYGIDFHSLLEMFSQIPALKAKIEKDTHEKIAQMETEYKNSLNLKDTKFQELFLQLHGNEKLISNLQSEINSCRINEDNLARQNQDLTTMYNIISTSTCWKITKPLRTVLDALKWMLNSHKTTRLFYKGLKYFKNNGLRSTKRKVEEVIESNNVIRNYYKSHLRSEEQLKKERLTQFDPKIKLSVLVPLYNTPKNFLSEMIQSVQNQTYENWELCLADGSDTDHGDVEKSCDLIAKKDSRVKYKKLKRNLGISENTNQCIAMATGEYLSLLDHDDILNPSALYEVMKVITEKGADLIYTDEATFENGISNLITAHFKPDFAIDNLRANNYICHFTSFSKKILDEVGAFRSECDGSQDHDLFLRLSNKASKIEHIPQLLYYWRSHKGSVAADINCKAYVSEAGKKAVLESLQCNGIEAEVESSKIFPTIYRINYKLVAKPLVSIIILNTNHKEKLSRCIDSILTKTNYDNYEIIVVDNNSTEPDIVDYYLSIKKNQHIHIIQSEDSYNYCLNNNIAAQHAKGKYLLLLNRSTQVISPCWMEEMLMYAQRPDVGAVGAKLYFADNTILHAGIILGMGTDKIAGYSHYKVDKNNFGYMGKLFYAQNVSAVSADCMLIKKSIFNEVGGMDSSFADAYNDVDLCLKIREKKYLVVFTPYAELYHYEPKQCSPKGTPEKLLQIQNEVQSFKTRWAKELAAGDPYYNPNLSLDSGNYALK